MNNIMCVKWGTLYGPEFVNNLYASCRRFLKQPFRFLCITNEAKKIHKDIEIVPNNDEHLKGWWQKIIYFKSPLYDVEGPVLAIDLDMIIVDDMAPFFEYEYNEFCMKEDFVAHGYSSCVMRFNANQYDHIYNNLNINAIDHAIDNSDRLHFKKKKYWGDQIWITEQMKNDPLKRVVKLWPSRWIPKFGKSTHKDPQTQQQFFVPSECKMIAWAGYKNDQRRYVDKIKHFWHSEDLSDEYR